MNRENKRIRYTKGYYRDHPCADSFTCKVCGRLVVPEGAGSGHRNHCPNCRASLHVDEAPGDRAADYLRDRGRDSLDLLVLTHFHADHANGVAELLERVRVDVLAVPDVEPDDPLRRELLALAEEKGTQVWLVREDARLAFGSAELTLYAPLGAGEANEEGLSLLCRAGDFTALFTGDMGADIEARLVKYGDLPQVDVLAVGHHGSKNAASPCEGDSHFCTLETRAKVTVPLARPPRAGAGYAWSLKPMPQTVWM